VDAEHARQDCGGQVGGELEQCGGAGFLGLTAFAEQVGAVPGVYGALLVGVAQVVRDLRQCRRTVRGDLGRQGEVKGRDGERFQRRDGRCGGGHQRDEQFLPPVPDLGIPDSVVLVGRFDAAVERV